MFIFQKYKVKADGTDLDGDDDREAQCLMLDADVRCAMLVLMLDAQATFGLPRGSRSWSHPPQDEAAPRAEKGELDDTGTGLRSGWTCDL